MHCPEYHMRAAVRLARIELGFGDILIFNAEKKKN
jgi:hypothetical protein